MTSVSWGGIESFSLSGDFWMVSDNLTSFSSVILLGDVISLPMSEDLTLLSSD